jgi:hypothetical protein
MAEAEYLSLAELDLLEQQELEGFRPEMDANASLPPIPAGKYQAKISFANESIDERWEKKNKDRNDRPITLRYQTVVRVETSGNGDEFDGRVMMFYPSTLVMKGSGTTSIQQILQPLGFGEALLTRTRTARTQIELMNDALEGEQALIGVNVDWEAQVYDKESEKTTFGPVRGMKRFPKDANGNHVPIIFKDLKGNEAPDAAGVNARNFIRGFMSLDALAGAGHVVAEVDEVQEQGVEEPVEETPVVVAPKPAVRSTVPAVAPSAPRPPATAPAVPQAQTQPRPAPRPTAAGRPSPVRRG